jgi:short-subunit dehydrogenase
MNVVITGASSGIGRALALTFARHGHPVLAVARREERLLALAQDAADHGYAAVQPLALDVTAEGAPQDVFAAAVRSFGRVHVLINNAGMSPYQEFTELSYDLLRQTLRLNVEAMTVLCHLFLPHMLAHGEPGHLVNVGSVGAYMPLPYFAVYSGSKHYLRVFTNTLHYECQGSNVRVSALHPGGVLTEFAALAGQGLRRSAVRAMMTPEQVADKAYPAILKGRRVIFVSQVERLAALVGKLLPCPWAIRLSAFVYDQAVEKIDPTYEP